MSISISNLVFIFSTSFMALFPVLNPIGNVFIVNGYFANLDTKQRKTAIQKLIANYVLMALGVLAVGHLLLIMFGLAIAVVQVGGGLLICKTAAGLLSGTDTIIDSDELEESSDIVKWQVLERKLFYPITFPISIGPGSISVIFTLMATASDKNDLMVTGVNYIVIALVIICMASILYVLLNKGQKIIQKLGPSGNLIINKLVAFFTFCIGIQIVVKGISEIFHINVL